jgi:aminoglycoside phosphotransferase (APT) family kinase protein
MDEAASGMPDAGARTQLVEFLRRSGLVAAECEPRLTPLTGGVASDIWKVECDGLAFVVKKALGRLRVAQEWMAPVSRNASEVAWMLEAAKVVPAAVPRILAHDPEFGAFAMAYLDPADHPVWKQELRVGRADPAFAAELGRRIAAIHSATAGRADVAKTFANDAVFHSIRLEPYLEATARAHPDLAERLMRLSAKTLASHKVLVHGDISPKNILVGPNGPVILDAECAWFGEPAFDLAFCLNHLLLKYVWTPSAGAAFLACFDALSTSYLAGVDWEPRADTETRAAELLPALLLARIDGKSPVEYITTADERERVRRFGRQFIASPPARLSEVRQAWGTERSL